jgi:hypothetical protein
MYYKAKKNTKYMTLVAHVHARCIVSSLVCAPRASLSSSSYLSLFCFLFRADCKGNGNQVSRPQGAALNVPISGKRAQCDTL